MEEKVLMEPLWERLSISNIGSSLKEDNPPAIMKGRKPVAAVRKNLAAEKFALAEKEEITI
jgi:hypothetical protein